jgi:multiple sugar transport system ATP-binding protein
LSEVVGQFHLTAALLGICLSKVPGGNRMASVRLERVSKNFPDGTTAVDNVDLEVNDCEFLVLVGPSGCGKSTTLRLIAGLEACSDGEIWIGARTVNNVPPKDRDIAMVFQNYALYPHMSVYKNLSFGLKLRSGGGVIARVLRRVFKPREAARLSQLRSGIDERVRHTAARLGIEKLLDRKPHQLSGGERQRVALGRAIVRNPAAFLFDEPLSNLDAKLRQQMRGELKRLHRELRTTMIYVTHDQVEALSLGDRVAVMNQGRILQLGPPLDVYQQPANLFVARFMGTAPINLLSGRVAWQDGKFIFDGGRFRMIAAGDEPVGIVKKQLLNPGQTRDVVIGFRPEHVAVSLAGSGEGMHAEAVVTAVDRLGDLALVHLDLTGSELYGGGLTGSAKEVKVASPEEPHSIVARVNTETELAVGDVVKLQVDPQRVLWFDPLTGENLLRDNK